MTPAPDTGPTAEETKLKEQIAYTMAMRTALRPSLVEGLAEWQRVGYSSPGQDARANAWKWYGAADALLAGPLAQLQADLIAARKERDEAREEIAAVERALEGVEETPLARRVGHWIGVAANECTRATAAEAEIAQLRSRLLQAEKGAKAMRDVQEAVVARWREAAMMAVGGDLRRLQRLLNASQGRIVGSGYAAGDEPRCTATGNPCGTDTVLVGRQCPDNRWGGRCAHRIAEAAKLALLTQEEGR
ncbi:hypothetical protein ACQKQD_19030 [Methylobacterium sp. NPDC080182]|uniref:hypothetical protein n=1 Tax=Methylobacterium sp. NPDC080182 TaxID=3390590 RepID=UPI003CFEC5DD